MTVSSSPPLGVSRLGHWDSQTQLTRIDGLGGSLLYIRVRPRARGQFVDQVRDLYQRLDELLDQQGAWPTEVVTEKIFFSDLDSQVDTFQQLRAEYYDRPNRVVGSFPAVTYLGQPPCRPGVQCELQGRIFIPDVPGSQQVTDRTGGLGSGAGKVVSSAGHHHLFLANVTGGDAGDDADFATQSQSMFSRATAALEREGLTFADVIRTWIYVDDIDRDYDELNRVRNTFFEEQGLRRLPASTGIQAGVWERGRGVSMDLYALDTQGLRVRTMQAPTMNEADSYGSAFSRGTTVTRDDRVAIYISGTASIDEEGEVVCVGDIQGQVKRMLRNIEELLAVVGAGKKDIIRATTYLKEFSFTGDFDRIWREQGFPVDAPHTVCRADVCRPTWLCETEVAAIVPLL